MATIAIQPRSSKIASRVSSRAINSVSIIKGFNKTAVLSVLLSVLFVSYFLVPHTGSIGSLYQFSILFVVIMPIVALASSLIAVHQISRTGDRGLMLSYVSLAITSLYFIVALAIPFVLIGSYLVYMYVL